MAMYKKGARKISVDGVLYRWRIRGRPTYAQRVGESNLSVAVEPVVEQGSVTTLVVDAAVLHPSASIEKTTASVTPATIAAYIRQALKQGWKPLQKGAAFTLVDEEERALTGETIPASAKIRF